MTFITITIKMSQLLAYISVVAHIFPFTFFLRFYLGCFHPTLVWIRFYKAQTITSTNTQTHTLLYVHVKYNLPFFCSKQQFYLELEWDAVREVHTHCYDTHNNITVQQQQQQQQYNSQSDAAVDFELRNSYVRKCTYKIHVW